MTRKFDKDAEDFAAVSAYIDTRLIDIKERILQLLRHARNASRAPSPQRRARVLAAYTHLEAGLNILKLETLEVVDRYDESQEGGQDESKKSSNSNDNYAR